MFTPFLHVQLFLADPLIHYILLILYMNIQITAKPLAIHKTFKYIQSSPKIWWLIITFLARIVSFWGCPTHFKTGTVPSYPKAYRLLHGARALQPSERLADIFGEALEGTLVAVKQPLLRCLVKRTWATWGGHWNCGTVKPPQKWYFAEGSVGRMRGWTRDSHGLSLLYPPNSWRGLINAFGGSLLWDKSAWCCKARRSMIQKQLLFWEGRW